MSKQFANLYPKIKPSIVAIASKISQNNHFPDIIGTGFIVREDGMIFTNDHVIKAIEKLPRLKSKPNDIPALVVIFYQVGDRGMAQATFDIKGIGKLGRSEPIKGVHYGPEIPDIGVVHIDVKNLPALKIASELGLQEGEEIFFAGYPKGTTTLREPGWMHQLSPTLQSGIISSILPFPCKNPHAILIDAVAQGGSSGSPIMNPEKGEVIGILYGGFPGSSLTYAVPAKVVSEIFNLFNNNPEINNLDKTKFLDWNEMISRPDIPQLIPKTPNPAMRPVDPKEIIRQL